MQGSVQYTQTEHLQPPVVCLFYLRGSTSCLTVVLHMSPVFIHQGGTLNIAAMGKQVRSDKEMFTSIGLSEFD